MTASPSSRRRWADLTPGQRIGVGALAAVQFALLGAALADLRRRRPAELTAPRWAWTAAAFVNFVGPLAYFAFGRRRAGACAPTGAEGEHRP